MSCLARFDMPRIAHGMLQCFGQSRLLANGLQQTARRNPPDWNLCFTFATGESKPSSQCILLIPVICERYQQHGIVALDTSYVGPPIRKLATPPSNDFRSSLLNMRIFFFRALWLSSVVTAELITITEWRKCSTSAVFPAPTLSNSTVFAGSSSTNSSAAAASTSARPPLLGSTGPGPAANTPQQNKVDFLFWLEFANAIRTAAGIKTGDSTAFFVGGDAQTGPLAGDNIDQTFTNEGIYQIANMLLSDSSIYYEPGTIGYVDALSK